MTTLLTIKLAALVAVLTVIAAMILHETRPVEFTPAQETRRAQLKHFAEPMPKKYLVP